MHLTTPLHPHPHTQALASLRLDSLGWVALLVQSLAITYMSAVLPLLTVRSPFLFFNWTHATALIGEREGGRVVCVGSCWM